MIAAAARAALSIDQEADQVVAEMTAIGADFEVTPSGPGGETRWIYSSRPGMREALRRFKAGIDLTRPGFEDAMVRAIRRLEIGAPS